ncbi:hypothetical protein [Pedobacter heparinus]|uniref:Uncharacterized protein n=1 Tax=Pedobacter heparinus (strain ATCC 13125 / DSM 2366 / CIP 104194 / JCM 7457 / NBRC 12017 / NCIMB 9290 / NRRL B-14731 / HIM 762-3) TaxID=485917 RepID=C6XUN3_PEDHD|nr:hypothetical protein [Pedobacter heparinus]ACU03883.1 hypothetical protein Phep_1672 [Pedobacter heparinus DSM 2366]
MEPITLCILSFPQRYENGRIVFNIVIIPRNLNPLAPLKDGQPAFADAQLNFKAMVINSLDGLPLTSGVNFELETELENPVENTRPVWEALKAQLEEFDGRKIDEDETRLQEQKAGATIEKYKDCAIRKYLPESYRAAFNFVKPKTRYALTGDEYQCAVKNKDKQVSDEPTDRDTLSWGKVIAYCLRNPLLAQKVGLIYKASVRFPENEKLFEEGGWLYTELAAGSDFAGIGKLQFAARIPALKGKNERILFAPVQFPVRELAENNTGYDEIMREAIFYDDGFAKIVHANQPVNQDLLQEKDKSNPPLKDIGLRLGWDDEQIAIWFNRQMLQKEEQTGNPVEAPLGVFGYRVDVKTADDDRWHSQNSVIAERSTALAQGRIQIAEAGAVLEPGIEVHPASHGNSKADGFWLPMYFSSWAGKPLTIADKDAEEINRLTHDQMVQPRPDLPDNTINSIAKKTYHPYVPDPEHVFPLVYGRKYQFRIRMMDISGGGPLVGDEPVNGGERPVAKTHFKRYVAAGNLNLLNAKEAYDLLVEGTAAVPLADTSILENIVDANNPVLRIKRPLLAYPAVVYTGKYTDAVAQLKAILDNVPAGPDKSSVDIGLADPDVDYFKVSVEVKSLEMDNVLSESGREPYILWYEKEYELDKALNKYDQEFALSVVYRDFKVLDFENGLADKGSAAELVLPTSRHLRLTFTPIIKMADNNYADEGILEGKKIRLTSFKPAKDERDLLQATEMGLKAIYLQPEHAADQNKVIGQKNFMVLNILKSSTPPELSRLADALNLSAHNLTIEGEKGRRTQFGCSKLMRHSLAPDSSSVSFSSLGELYNQWIIAVDYTLKRDWAWDGLMPESVSVYRKWKHELDVDYPAVDELAGTIRLSDTANINALYDADRESTRLIFLDAFDPKKANDAFPTETMLEYRIVLNFRPEFSGSLKDVDPETGKEEITAEVHLPVTIIPHQVPQLVSAGIALSPYVADVERYASTEMRQRFLWLEMAEPPADPNDTYFVRVLANAPDPLLCNMNGELISYDPADPPLGINEEKIRVISPGMDNDFAGMGAMQQMIAEDNTGGNTRYYMVPLPPGLHADSDELFGFFTYEIRLGHKKELWSTAQARYGRPLKVNGVQHPAPALSCNAFRRKYEVWLGLRGRVLENKKIPVGLFENNERPGRGKRLVKKITNNELVITAPFAMAVLNGKNVSARPPQTSLWYMLYTQVRQADGMSYRNLLIDSDLMPYVPLKSDKREDGTLYGTAVLKLEDVEAKLVALGLPANSSLSVLCVEMFPLDNTWHMESGRNVQLAAASGRRKIINPLTEGLGGYRIYRTSALVPVADVCCDDC